MAKCGRMQKITAESICRAAEMGKISSRSPNSVIIRSLSHQAARRRIGGSIRHPVDWVPRVGESNSAGVMSDGKRVTRVTSEEEIDGKSPSSSTSLRRGGL